MANKICTSIEQSKKLMELGIDVNTADMRYGCIAPYDFSDRTYDGGYDEVPYPKDFLKKNPNFSENEYDGELPCWSLAALLDILPKNLDIGRPVLATNYRGYYWVVYFDEYMKETNLTSKIYDNPVDACYEMILKLNEQKLL